MKLKTVFQSCDRIISSLEAKNPGRGINTPDGRVTFKELSEELKNLCGWCYEDSVDVQKVVRCKNCKYYKQAKIQDEKYSFRHKSLHMCTLTKQQYRPEFFCANGKERD